MTARMRSTRSWLGHARSDRARWCAQRDTKVSSLSETLRSARSLTALVLTLLGLSACASSASNAGFVPYVGERRAPLLATGARGVVTTPAAPDAGELTPRAAPPRWSEERAHRWYAERGWLVGVNYIPSTAINQLEMWHAETFDPASIDRELGWAESLGFNSLRVFLHDLSWKEDEPGLYARMDQFLDIAHKHQLGVMFVIFDGVWNPSPTLGKQPAPRPFVHNSGWVQSPGAEILGNAARHAELEPYVKGVVGRFRADARIDAWDVFNEPDNRNTESYGELDLKDKSALAALLIEKAFRWAREAGATQPLTAAPWLTDFSEDAPLSPSDQAMLAGSDIISFHNYATLEDMRLRVTNLRRYRRPILCTEFMARPVGSTFNPILGYLKQQGGGAYSWGLVSGKSQTIYPWTSWKEPTGAPPEPWFHDIFDADGKPYDPKEVAYIRSVTGKRGVEPILLKASPPG